MRCFSSDVVVVVVGIFVVAVVAVVVVAGDCVDGCECANALRRRLLGGYKIKLVAASRHSRT